MTVGEIDMIYLTQDRSAVTKEGGVCLALGERKFWEKWAIEGRKGLMSLKMEDICMSFPCRLAASCSVTCWPSTNQW